MIFQVDNTVFIQQQSVFGKSLAIFLSCYAQVK